MTNNYKFMELIRVSDLPVILGTAHAGRACHDLIFGPVMFGEVYYQINSLCYFFVNSSAHMLVHRNVDTSTKVELFSEI